MPKTSSRRDPGRGARDGAGVSDQQPIKLFVAANPGGATDALVRVTADFVSPPNRLKPVANCLVAEKWKTVVKRDKVVLE